ncbi:RNA-binding protein [archaeon]|nr:RNA-binding protein [archaeon]|tara:strand:- start:444 stop:1208 length:765 start_codon:yes stop_codon:yes gene_type:complete
MSENYILDLIKQDSRIDGRKLKEFRKPVKIETGISKNAEGSAKATIGETEVIAGIKLSLGEPYPDNPDEGTIMVTSELLPMASEEFESGPPGKQAIELARIIDRGIRESKALDFKKLCIKKGELIWLVFIDIYPINDAGNLIDASALATVAALKEVKFPKLEKNKIKYGELTKDKLPLTKIPITCTLVKIGDKILVDPNSEEEQVIDARLSVAVCGNKINAMQKGGIEGLSFKEIDEMMDIAFEKEKELRKAIQ